MWIGEIKLRHHTLQNNHLMHVVRCARSVVREQCGGTHHKNRKGSERHYQVLHRNSLAKRVRIRTKDRHLRYTCLPQLSSLNWASWAATWLKESRRGGATGTGQGQAALGNPTNDLVAC